MPVVVITLWITQPWARIDSAVRSCISKKEFILGFLLCNLTGVDLRACLWTRQSVCMCEISSATEDEYGGTGSMVLGQGGERESVTQGYKCLLLLLRDCQQHSFHLLHENRERMSCQENIGTERVFWRSLCVRYLTVVDCRLLFVLWCFIY